MEGALQVVKHAMCSYSCQFRPRLHGGGYEVNIIHKNVSIACMHVCRNIPSHIQLSTMRLTNFYHKNIKESDT